MLEEIVTQLAKSNINSENDWYKWRDIKEDKLPSGVILPQGNQYKKNVELKVQLSEQLKKANATDDRLALIKYYIATWGGIHGNSRETMNLYCQSFAKELIDMGSKGIASWSKALCVIDPSAYAIYDARVAASLNALQIINNVESKILYPVLISRNNTISQGIKLIKLEARKSKWKPASECCFYREYLRVLKSASDTLPKKHNASIWTIEMLLFAMAEELVIRAFPSEKF